MNSHFLKTVSYTTDKVKVPVAFPDIPAPLLPSSTVLTPVSEAGDDDADFWLLTENDHSLIFTLTEHKFYLRNIVILLKKFIIFSTTERKEVK